MTCVLCKATNASFNTIEHAVPESLGGGEWSELPAGLVCDSCQKYFGAKVERDALADYPFLFLRTLLSMPTKKGRAPWLQDALEGRLEASGTPGRVWYEPSAHFADANFKTQMRFVAQPKNPRVICRLLLKMGIEAIAMEDPQLALHGRFDAARAVARGISTASWWYQECTDMNTIGDWLCGQAPQDEPLVQLAFSEPGPGAEMVSFQLGPITLLAPMKSNIYPEEGLNNPPEWRVYKV